MLRQSVYTIMKKTLLNLACFGLVSVCFYPCAGFAQSAGSSENAVRLPPVTVTGRSGNDRAIPDDVAGDARFLQMSESYGIREFGLSNPIIDFSRPGPDAANTRTNECPTAKPVLRSSLKKLLFETDFESEGSGGLDLTRNYKTGEYNWLGIFGASFNTIYDTSLVLVFELPNQWYDPNDPENGEPPTYTWPCEVSYAAGAAGTKCLEDVKQVSGDPSILPQSVYRRDAQGNYITLHTFGPNYWADDSTSPSYTMIRNGLGNYVLSSFDGEQQTFRSDGKPLTLFNVRGVGITFTYAANGRFTNVTHTSGRSIQFTWSEPGVIASLVAPNGKQFTYQYNYTSANHANYVRFLTDVTYPDALGVRSYIYGTTQATQGLIVGVKVNGTQITEYDYLYGSVKSSGMVGGVEKSTFSWLAEYRYETNALGLKTTYTYINAAGQTKLASISRPASVSCPSASQSSAYDGRGFLTSQVDWAGNKSEFQYDAKGRMLQETSGVGPGNDRTNIQIVKNTWNDATSQLLTTTRFARDGITPLSKKIFEYFPINDALGRNFLPSATTEVDCTPNCTAGPSRRTEYRYTIHPNKMLATVQVDGPLSGTADTTTLQYNAQGDLISQTNALNQQALFQNHNGFGQPANVIDESGVSKTFTYDGKGRVTSTATTTPRAVITYTYQYDAEDRLTYISNGQGDWARNIYDVQGRLIRTEKPGTNPNVASSLDVVEYAYNLLSQPTSIKTKRIDTPVSGTPVTTVFSIVNKNYNTAGLLISETGNNGQNVRYEYNQNGQLAVTYDSLNQATRFYYDSHGRLNRVVSPVGTTLKGYDQLGRLSSVTDPNNNQTRYFYNNFDDLIREESPATGITTFAYDPAGRQISEASADNRVTQYTLDVLGRTTSLIANWPPATADMGQLTQTFTYDSCTSGVGKLCSVSDHTGSLHYTYDATAGIKREQYNSENGKSYFYDFAFDTLDRTTSQTFSDGNAILYQYSPHGTIRQIQARVGASGTPVTVATEITSPPYGAYTSLNHGNGVIRTRSFDLDGRITSINSGSSTISKNYGYNANNLITQISNNLDATLTQNFAYDTVSRLTGITSASGNQAFTYDLNSNRTSHTWGGSVDTYQLASGNKLTGITGARSKSFVLDAVGNLTRETTGGINTEHFYDPFNREIWLQRLSPSSRCEPNRACEQLPAGTWQYGVNAFGQRTYKYTMSTTGQVYGLRHYLYGIDGNLAAEGDGIQGALQSEYIWLGGEPIGMIRNGEVFRIHSDHLDRPEAVSNNAGAVVWKAKNYAFDRVVALDNIGGLNLGFPGQYFDSESNTWYNNHRQYDGLLGRYTQGDPTGLIGGLNTFGYANANPLSFIDPTGLVSEDIVPAKVLQNTRYTVDAISGHAFNDSEVKVLTSMIIKELRYTELYPLKDLKAGSKVTLTKKQASILQNVMDRMIKKDTKSGGKNSAVLTKLRTQYAKAIKDGKCIIK